MSVTPWRIFITAFKLGTKSFGGPVAHLKVFDRELVNRRQWASSREFQSYIALASLLPGPSSSQVGLALAARVGGLLGSLLFWLGFTLPSAILMFAFSKVPAGQLLENSVIRWLIKALLVIVIARALWAMQKTLASTWSKRALALVSAIVFITLTHPIAQISWLFIAAIIGIILLPDTLNREEPQTLLVSHRFALMCLMLFITLLVLLPLLFESSLFNLMYQTGAMVFGGGHVVLPMMQTRFVESGLIDSSTFALGYLLAQAMPGPLFAFSAFVGSLWLGPPHGLLGSITAVIAIFLPGALLMFSGLYFWQRWSNNQIFRSAVGGINAAVLGALIAALFFAIQ